MSLIAPGVRLHDRFTVVERVGAGGMSEVWRATDELLGRQVAVKVLATADPAGVTWREARAAARLTHPNVTQVHDYGEARLPDGRIVPYLVMELVEGQALASRLPLPWPEAVRVAEQVAAALAAAHQIGVVHRDIKPGNVMLTETGVKVLDFGIAAVVGADTDPGRMAGTPTYTAPERLDPGRPAAPASDVYSLAVLLYETLTGHPPVRLHTWAEAAAAHRAGLTVPELAVPGLPEPVARLCHECLAPDPGARPPARRVAAALETAAALAGQVPPTSPTPHPPPRPAPMPPLRPTVAGPAGPSATPPTRMEEPEGVDRRWRLVGIGAVLAAALLGVALLVNALSPDQPDRPAQAGGEDPAASAPAVTALATTATTAPATTAPATTAPGTSPPPPASPTAPPPDNVVAALERAIDDGVEAGTVSEEAQVKVEAKLDDLRDSLAEQDDDPDQQRDKAADVQKEIDQMEEKGEIERDTADRLTDILQPLL